MSCGCGTYEKDGKAIVDKVREIGRDKEKLTTPHLITCSCGEDFTKTTLVDNCPKCKMTYGVTPCTQEDKSKVKPADINY